MKKSKKTNKEIIKDIADDIDIQISKNGVNIKVPEEHRDKFEYACSKLDINFENVDSLYRLAKIAFDVEVNPEQKEKKEKIETIRILTSGFIRKTINGGWLFIIGSINKDEILKVYKMLKEDMKLNNITKTKERIIISDPDEIFSVLKLINFKTEDQDITKEFQKWYFMTQPLAQKNE